MSTIKHKSRANASMTAWAVGAVYNNRTTESDVYKSLVYQGYGHLVETVQNRVARLRARDEQVAREQRERADREHKARMAQLTAAEQRAHAILEARLNPTEPSA